MDQRQVELQLRVIVVTYRAALKRGDAQLDGFRERAVAILDRLTAEAEGDSNLSETIEAVRREVVG